MEGGPPASRMFPSPRRFPLGLLGAIVLAVAVESTLDRRMLDFGTPLTVQYRATVAALSELRDAELVCFGDSLIKMAVLPRVIRQETGLPAYNLALLGGPPTSGYFLLRRVLEQGTRPKAILVGYTPYMLERPPLDAARGLHEIITPAEALDLACTAREPQLFAAMLLGRFLPSARCRWEVRANLMQALRGEVPTIRWANVLHQRNWAANRGSQVSAPPAPAAAAAARAGPIAAEPAGPEVEMADQTAAWKIHPLNAAYVERFLDLADARGIAVYWLLPPIRPDVQARLERIGRDGQYAQFLRGLQAAFPRMLVVDGRHAGYASSLFSDPIHIHRLGAPAYSTALSEVLLQRRSPAEPRWIELPPYRATSPSAAVEDLAQSLQALRNRSTRRR